MQSRRTNMAGVCSYRIISSFNRWFNKHNSDFDALVFDIDGILMLSGKAIPGSIELLTRLRREKRLFSLLTNDGNHSIAEKYRFLRRCGLHIHAHEMTSCSDGLVELADRLHLRGKLFFIVGDLGKPNYCVKAGIRFTRSLAELPHCDGVIISEDNYDWEPVINGVVNFFMNHPGSRMFVPNPDTCYPVRNEMKIASGGVARLIQRVLSDFHVNIEPIYLGKPYRPIFQHNHLLMERRLGRKIRKERVLMLGDSIASDVLGGLNFGYRTALFLTGMTKESVLARSNITPDLVFRGY